MRTLLLLAMLMIATPAYSVNDWGFGGGCNQSTTDTSVGDGEKICFDMNASLASPFLAAFHVTASSAIACLKTDVDQEGVSATGASPVTAIVRYCPNADFGATLASGDANDCGIQACPAAGCTLTGLNGIPSAQLACVVIGPGAYIVSFPTLPDSPDVGLFSVEGAP